MTESKSERVVPYDTGKVKIGCMYQRPSRADMTPEEVRIQRLLLDGSPYSLADRVLYLIFAIVCLLLSYLFSTGH
jgi:hypothetical protein